MLLIEDAPVCTLPNNNTNSFKLKSIPLATPVFFHLHSPFLLPSISAQKIHSEMFFLSQRRPAVIHFGTDIHLEAAL